MFPGAQRMNRGNHEIPTLVRACKANNVTDLVILHETRGQPGERSLSVSLTFLPAAGYINQLVGAQSFRKSVVPADGLVVCHLPFGPTAYFTLYNVVMRHDVPDIGTMSEAYPHLIFHNFTSRLGKRVSGEAAPWRAVFKLSSYQKLFCVL